MNPYEQTETRFYDFLTGGVSYNTNDPDVKIKISEINDSAKVYWDSMEKGQDRSFIWESLKMDFSGENLPASITLK